MLATMQVAANPRMISYGYPNCISCHVSVQGRGLLSSYGRGIEIAQSYSQADLTGLMLGSLMNAGMRAKDGTGVLATSSWTFSPPRVSINGLITGTPTRPYPRFIGRSFMLVNAIVFASIRRLGFAIRDSSDTRVGPNRTLVGGDSVFLKKLLIEWRLEESGAETGQELAFGRDYLPLGSANRRLLDFHFAS